MRGRARRMCPVACLHIPSERKPARTRRYNPWAIHIRIAAAGAPAHAAGATAARMGRAAPPQADHDPPAPRDLSGQRRLAPPPCQAARARRPRAAPGTAARPPEATTRRPLAMGVAPHRATRPMASQVRRIGKPPRAVRPSVGLLTARSRRHPAMGSPPAIETLPARRAPHRKSGDHMRRLRRHRPMPPPGLSVSPGWRDHTAS
jgi:hypothetical protein